MNDMAAEFSGRVDFLSVYIAEAHASDAWPLGNIVATPDHKSMEERLAAANDFVTRFGSQLPCVVDGMTNAFDEAFAVWPERFYVVDNDRTMYLVGYPTNEFGYDRELLRIELHQMLICRHRLIRLNLEQDVEGERASMAAIDASHNRALGIAVPLPARVEDVEPTVADDGAATAAAAAPTE